MDAATLSTIISGFLLACIPLAVGLVAWIGRKVDGWMKERHIDGDVRNAVFYAEQLCKAYQKLHPETVCDPKVWAERKLKWATEAASAALFRHGIELPAAVLRTTIEAAVYRYFTAPA